MTNNAIHTIATARAPLPSGHYAQAIVAGGMLYISGQLPVSADGHRATSMDFDAQARRALSNVLTILDDAGSRPELLVRIAAYIVGIGNWTVFNEVCAELLPNIRPARTVVPVPELHHGFLVEIDAIALRCGE